MCDQHLGAAPVGGRFGLESGNPSTFHGTKRGIFSTPPADDVLAELQRPGQSMFSNTPASDEADLLRRCAISAARIVVAVLPRLLGMPVHADVRRAGHRGQ